MGGESPDVEDEDVMGKWEEDGETRRSFVLRGAHHIFLKVFLVNSRFLWGGGRLSFVLCLSGLVEKMRRWGMVRAAMLRTLVLLVI